MHYPADHTPVVHARNATRSGGKGFNALKLSLSQPELGEARAAYKRAFEAQLAVYTGKPPTG